MKNVTVKGNNSIFGLENDLIVFANGCFKRTKESVIIEVRYLTCSSILEDKIEQNLKLGEQKQSIVFFLLQCIAGAI